MSAILEFKKRWIDVRTSYNWGVVKSFFYAVNGWMSYAWLGFCVVVGFTVGCFL